VAATKTHSEKQMLTTGTKQSKQANKADGLTKQTGQLGLPKLLQACLLCFVPSTSALLLLK